ncbi:hypothetical protein Acr_05g0007670 [Actinidia rufa]|uniref:Uncharacterized protein n=1 Tax=Actinidia rufa TaxID=165716 RepID=A0A7J0EKY4_9ERIC|nr:hypothetical protein Acr_05g0007670 [Actinidia rufa]
MRKIFPSLPDLTLIRLLEEKIQHPFLELGGLVKSKAAPKLRSDVMSNKIDLKKLAQMEKRMTSKVKGVVIGEKCHRDEMPDISPIKKGKQATDTKKKGPMLLLEEKKEAPSKSKTTPSQTTSKVANAKSIQDEMVQAQNVTKKLEGQLAEHEAEKQHTTEELRREAVEWATSKFYDKSFDLCKKQIGHLHAKLDIQDLQIDPELVMEVEGEEKGKLDDSPSPNRHLYVDFFPFGGARLMYPQL